MRSRIYSLKLTLTILLLSSSFARADDYNFQIGVSIPLSGAFAEFGVAVKNGFTLAREEDPRAFQSITITFEDDRYDPKTTVSNFSKFVEINQVDLVFVWGNEPALGIVPLAERKRVPTVVVAQHPKAAAGYRYVIRFINPAQDYAKAILEYLRAKQLKKIGAIKAEISFFNILLDELKLNLLPDESLVEVETVLPQEVDFRSAIGKLKKRDFDILGVYLVPPQVGPFYRQAAAQAFHPQTFGTTIFESETVIRDALGLMSGAVYSHITADDSFRDRYRKRFNDDSELGYAANAFDFANLMAKLFGDLSSRPHSEAVLSAISGVTDGVGASGPYRASFQPRYGKFFSFPVVVKKVDGGRISVLPRVTAEN